MFDNINIIDIITIVFTVLSYYSLRKESKERDKENKIEKNKYKLGLILDIFLELNCIRELKIVDIQSLCSDIVKAENFKNELYKIAKITNRLSYLSKDDLNDNMISDKIKYCFELSFYTIRLIDYVLKCKTLKETKLNYQGQAKFLKRDTNKFNNYQKTFSNDFVRYLEELPKNAGFAIPFARFNNTIINNKFYVNITTINFVVEEIIEVMEHFVNKLNYF